MKAWRIIWLSIPDRVGIFCATTRGKALAIAARALKECGYKFRWQDLKCRRAPEYDAWAERQSGRWLAHGILEEYVKQKASVR